MNPCTRRGKSLVEKQFANFRYFLGVCQFFLGCAFNQRIEASLQKVQAVDETGPVDGKCYVLFHVVGDASHFSVKLRHFLYH